MMVYPNRTICWGILHYHDTTSWNPFFQISSALFFSRSQWWQICQTYFLWYVCWSMKLIKPIIYHDFPCWWYTYPSEKYERQLGLLYYSQLNGKNEIHVPNHKPVSIYSPKKNCWSPIFFMEIPVGSSRLDRHQLGRPPSGKPISWGYNGNISWDHGIYHNSWD